MDRGQRMHALLVGRGGGRHRNAELADAAAERQLRTSIKILLAAPKAAGQLLEQALGMAADQGMLRLQTDVLADLIEMHHNFVRCDLLWGRLSAAVPPYPAAMSAHVHAVQNWLHDGCT